MKPDWTKAPEEAKPKPIHWDTKNQHFCDVDGWWDKAGEYRALRWGHIGWDTDRYIQRPVDSKDKTEELIMTEPNWEKAPEKATQWDKVFRLFCNASGWFGEDGRYILKSLSGPTGCGTDRYTPRPVAPAPAPTEWVDGWPTIGEECTFNPGGPNYVVTPVAYYDGSVIFYDPGGIVDMYDGCSDLECFRPMPTPEQLKRQSIIDKAFAELSEFSYSAQVLGELYDAGMLRAVEE